MKGEFMMRIKQFFFLLVMMVILLHPYAAVKAAGDVELSDISNKYRGNEVTISGTSSFAEVIAKVYDPANLILYVNVIPVGNDGKFSNSFTLAGDAMYGTYKVVVGQEETVVTDTFVVEARSTGGGGNGGGSPSAGSGTTTEITVDVESGKEGTAVSKTVIKRTKETDGKITDAVVLTERSAAETIQKLSAQSDNTARIVIPDVKDEVDEVSLSIPRAALNELKIGKIDLEIETENAKLMISSSTLFQFNEDIYFRIVPVKEEKEKAEVKERAEKERMVKDLANGRNIQVLGRPAEIDTNMQSQPVTVVLPLIDVDLPQNEQERQAYLGNIVIFVEHSDDTKELVAGEVVTYENNTPGIQFEIDKFSTFTMVHMEGLNDKIHDAYINGYPDHTFRPNAPVTRAQMAAILARNLGIEKEFGTQSGYKDVPGSHWAFNEIMTAKKYGIMLGNEDLFKPNGSITRAQMATIAYRWVKSECENNGSSHAYCSTLEDTAGVKYTDVSNDHWAAQAILAIHKTKMMEGYENGTFNPEGKLTRAQAIKVLNRLFNRGPLFGEIEPTFTDVPKDHWAFREIEEAARKHTFNIEPTGKEYIINEVE
jgi:hypothetical protein